ncbi:hypothetical protein HHI36_012119 [Cryptolaemus montrouzieri]|uniref:Uncharacterized protein n=1 Tax=Cryptolaemus montrouzieri TaxID=559131 RepID=A0ABD2NDT7_9CUCU
MKAFIFLTAFVIASVCSRRIVITREVDVPADNQSPQGLTAQQLQQLRFFEQYGLVPQDAGRSLNIPSSELSAKDLEELELLEKYGYVPQTAGGTQEIPAVPEVTKTISPKPQRNGDIFTGAANLASKAADTANTIANDAIAVPEALARGFVNGTAAAAKGAFQAAGNTASGVAHSFEHGGRAFLKFFT